MIRAVLVIISFCVGQVFTADISGFTSSVLSDRNSLSASAISLAGVPSELLDESTFEYRQLIVDNNLYALSQRKFSETSETGECLVTLYWIQSGGYPVALCRRESLSAEQLATNEKIIEFIHKKMDEINSLLGNLLE